MKHVVAKPDVFVDKNINPMDELGIGANMVKALRYWLPAVGLTIENTKGKRTQELTEIGKMVSQYDTYIEEQGTLQLLQYKLASNQEDATAWYFFFNEFSMLEFTKEDFVQQLQKYVLMTNAEESVAIRSLNDDFSCIVNTYLPRYKSNPSRVSPENNIDCPLGEIGLIDILNKKKKTYKKSTMRVMDANPWVMLAIILDQANGRSEVGLNELLTAPCNIGRCFNLDAITMLEILHSVEKEGGIKIVRTAGLDVVQIHSNMSFDECIAAYYSRLDD